MVQLKHGLMATTGLVMLITAVARLNALHASALSTSAPDVFAVEGHPQKVFERIDDEPGDDVTPSPGSVYALFNLHHPETAPFPSDIFTVEDRRYSTWHRVNLPYPDCAVRVSDCEDIAVLNSLDGFNLQPRLSVPFSGSIDANSVTSDTVFLVSLGSTRSDQGYMPPGSMVGIDQKGGTSRCT
jgi:hypothetical protein